MDYEKLREIAKQDEDLVLIEREFYSVVDYIINSPSVDYLTIPFVTKSTGVERNKATKILFTLSGAPYKLLEARFRFVDSETDENVNTEDLLEAYEHGRMAHPISGAVIDNFTDYVFPYYEPSEELEDLRAPRS